MDKDFKQALYTVCKEQLQEKVTALQNAMEDIQNSANNETKSSAGDKYETGRAMMHLEKNKLAGQLAEVIKQQQALGQVVVNKTCTEVEFGALVKTNKNLLFIATSLGKLMLEKQSCFVISPNAPLGQALMGAKEGDSIPFRNQQFKIVSIF
ncbi:MAG: GreA/GreB family elongation factor [Aureispira sp.]|nr:GreA/GreB family elongation factor [Aureispira sp.]